MTDVLHQIDAELERLTCDRGVYGPHQTLVKARAEIVRLRAANERLAGHLETARAGMHECAAILLKP